MLNSGNPLGWFFWQTSLWHATNSPCARAHHSAAHMRSFISVDPNALTGSGLNDSIGEALVWLFVLVSKQQVGG